MFDDEKIISIAVSPKKGIGFWVLDREWSQVRSFIEDKSTLIIGHNLKYDLKRLISKGYLSQDILYEDRLFDTILAVNVLDENTPDKGLKSLSYRNTSMVRYGPPDDWSDISGVRKYNCRDVDANKRLKNYCVRELNKASSLWIPFKIDMRTMAVLTDMELKGVRVDESQLSIMCKGLKEKLNSVSLDLGIDNPRSNLQVGKALVDFGFPLRKTDKGNYITDSSCIKGLIRTAGGENKKVLESLLKYRKYYKLYSAFVKGLLKRINDDGRIYPVYQIAKRESSDEDDIEGGGTVTGRLSCKNPNFQQIPRDKDVLEKELNPRRLFIPDSPDMVIGASDFSQIEMVLAGLYYKESKLVDMYLSGEDIHTQVAAEVWGVKLKNVTVDQRKAAKAINFGILYGISEYGLAEQLGWGVDEARVFIYKYFIRFSRLKVGIESLKHSLIAKGYVESYFKRRRRLSEASEKTAIGRAQLRQGINHPIQSTAGDLTKICMWELFKELRGKRSRIMGNVHDEIVKSICKKEKGFIVDLVKEVYSNPPVKQYGVEPFPIKFKGEIELGSNWLDLNESIKF